MLRVVGNPELRDARWHKEDGTPAEGNHAIFPICTLDSKRRLALIGTGFFICTNGLFVTAKHVLMDQSGTSPIQPLTAIQFIPGGQYLRRPVTNISVNNTDVAIGSLASGTHNVTGEPLLNPILTLTTEVPNPTSIITTFAYPKSFVKDDDLSREIHFETTWHSGYIMDYLPNGRDKVMLPGPCYRTTMDVFHGASGGPVMNTATLVFAVNSTGYAGVQESYVSAIQSIGGLQFSEVLLSGESTPRPVTTNELIDRGFIVVK